MDDEEDEAEVVISEKVSEGEAEKFAELEEIAFRTGQIFQADASLSLMSYDSQIFIAGREGCIDRDNTVCSHALLKVGFPFVLPVLVEWPFDWSNTHRLDADR